MDLPTSDKISIPLTHTLKWRIPLQKLDSRDIYWTNINQDPWFNVEEYKINEFVGMPLRKLKGAKDPHSYRIVTAGHPRREVVVAKNLNDIRLAYRIVHIHVVPFLSNLMAHDTVLKFLAIILPTINKWTALGEFPSKPENTLSTKDLEDLPLTASFKKKGKRRFFITILGLVEKPRLFTVHDETLQDVLDSLSSSTGKQIISLYDSKDVKLDSLDGLLDRDYLTAVDEETEWRKKKSTAIRAPGPPPSHGIGNLMDVLPSILPACRKLYLKYGPFFTMTLLGTPGFFVTDPELLESIVNLQDKRLPIQEMATQSVFTSDGESWSIARRTLNPVFGLKKIETFYPTFYKQAQAMLTTWDKLSGSVFDVTEILEESTFNVICDVGFSMKPPPDFITNYTYAFNTMRSRQYKLQALKSLPLPSNHKFYKSLNRLNNTVDNMVSSHDPKSVDLLSLIADAKHPDKGCPMGKEWIRDQSITVLVAGHKTTTLYTSWALFVISQHPAVEKKILQELVDIFDGGDVTWEGLLKCQYLEQTLKEVARLYPPGQSCVRGTPDEMVVGGYYCPAGSVFLVNVVDIHRLPKYWPDPLVFNPDRFSSENIKKMHPYQWIPFGAGGRSCIGMLFGFNEVRTMLATWLPKYSFHIPPGTTPKTGSNPLKITGGMKLLVKKRDPSTLPKKGEKPVILQSHSRIIRVPLAESDSIIQSTVPSVPITIAYGSNQDTCLRFAQILSKQAVTYNFIPEIVLLDDFSLTQFAKDKKPLIVVTSTYNGLPPDNAQKFEKRLEEAKKSGVSLIDTKFAIFGAGNSKWHTTFQKFPRIIKRSLGLLGSEMIAVLGEGDEDGDIESDFVNWSRLVWPVWCLEYGVVPVVSDNGPKPHFKASWKKNVKPEKPSFPEYSSSKIIETRELHSAESEGSAKHIEFNLPSGLKYTTGDHLAVLPVNPSVLVEELAGLLNVNPDDCFKLGSTQLNSSIRVPPWGSKIRSVRQVLTHYIDITSPVSQPNLEILSYYATDTKQKDEMKALSGYDGKLKFQDLSKTFHNISEILKYFKSVKMDFVHLLEILPPLKHRYYSISSSPIVSPKSVCLTVGKNTFLSGSGGTINGLCSSYLLGLSSGSEVMVTVKKGPRDFKLPKSIQTPVIFIASGTGYAPFRGFIQERFKEPNDQRSHFLPAESRGTGEKLYVQHVVRREADLIWDLLTTQKGHLYICGSASGMAAEVHKELTLICISKGSMTPKKAQKYLDGLSKEGRYARDVWG